MQSKVLMLAATFALGLGHASHSWAQDAGSMSAEEYVAASKALIERAVSGPVYSAVDLDLAKPSDFESMTTWKGPTSAPAPKKDVSLQIVVCLVGTACETSGQAAAEAAQALGWKATVIDGKGTPQGNAQAFASAMAANPDAIVVVAVDQSAIADQLAEARAKGIPVVAIAVKNPPEGGYDSTVTRVEVVASMLEAWYAIADSDGKAQVVFLWDQGYPHLVEGLERAQKILSFCTGCEVLEVYNRTLATAINAAAMQQLTTSIMQKYASKRPLYVLTPYGFGVLPMVASIAGSGDTGIKLVSKNAQAENLALVAKGEQAADFGSSLDWWGYAAVDQLIRLLAGEAPLEDAQQGLGYRAYVQSNAAEGNDNWTAPVDFKAEYLKIWGVK